MVSSSLLKDLLFISNPKVLGLSNYLNQTALMFVLPAFYLGIISECFTNFDFKGVLKRAVIAYLAITLLTPIHVAAVDQSLKVSSELLKRYSPQNKFLTAYQEAKSENTDSGKKGVWGKLTSIVKMLVDDPIVMIIFLLSYIAFFLLTQLYSLTFHLTIAMIGLCAVLSILPITSGSLKGAVKSSLWCILMPFVVAIILCLIGDSDAFFKTYSGGIVQNLESLIQLLIMTIILLLAPMITTRLMTDSGVSQMAESLGQMAAMSTLVGSTSLMTKFVAAKAGNMGAALHNSTSKPLMSMVKGAVSNKAQAISKDKGLGASMKTLNSKNPIDKLKGSFGDLSDNLKSTSFKEKVVLGADSVLNKKENGLAREARIREMSKSNSSLPSSNASNRNPQNAGERISRPDFKESMISANQKVPLSKFKKVAGEYLKSSDEIMNGPKLNDQFLQHRNSSFRNQKMNINSKKVGDRASYRKNLETKGGANDYRHV